ncbi:MAG: hypothetical protein DMF77_16765, partial [Acidobacteria bacterium]
IAAFATLLSSDALDYGGAYRVPWAMTFLLKPNHALGLVLLPWVVRGFAGIRSGRDRLKVGILLHLLGWVFVIHMGIACVGLLALATIATCRGERDARRDWLDAAVVIAINVLVVTPYLVLLFRGYGVFDAGPRLQIPPGSPHALEVITRMAWLTALAGWGAVTAWRRDRLGRVWVGQAAGAVAVWTAYYALSALQQAKERWTKASAIPRGAPPSSPVSRFPWRCRTGGIPREWTSTSAGPSSPCPRRCATPPDSCGPRWGRPPFLPATPSPHAGCRL